jgi:hypothetical protein
MQKPPAWWPTKATKDHTTKSRQITAQGSYRVMQEKDHMSQMSKPTRWTVVRTITQQAVLKRSAPEPMCKAAKPPAPKAAVLTKLPSHT